MQDTVTEKGQAKKWPAVAFESLCDRREDVLVLYISEEALRTAFPIGEKMTGREIKGKFADIFGGYKRYLRRKYGDEKTSISEWIFRLMVEPLVNRKLEKLEEELMYLVKDLTEVELG